MSALALERCYLRLSIDDKRLVQYAAQLSGVSLASFIRQVAVREAEKVIEQDKIVYLTAQESRELLEAIDRPFAPNAKLQEAMDLAEQIINNSKQLNRDGDCSPSDLKPNRARLPASSTLPQP